jgi:hypothetical protein
MNDKTDTDIFLVQFAATNLFSYILDTRDLSVIRGASSQLEDFAKKVAHAASALSARVVYAGASEILLSMDTEDTARNACKWIEAELKKDLRCATGAVACEPLPRGADLDACRARLESKLRREQLRRASVVPSQSRGSKPCDIDGIRPQEGAALQAGARKGEYPSAHTRTRYELGRRLRVGLLGDIFTPPEDKSEWRQSFEDLEALNPAERSSVKGKMCVIQVDGNAFGACRNSLKTLDGLHAFSEVVDEALMATLKGVLTDLWTAGQVNRILGCHLLYRAGDEFCLVVPARYGLEVLSGLLTTFSTRAADAIAKSGRDELCEVLGGGTLTLAAGAVFCDTHEPIQRATRLATELCDAAKAKLGKLDKDEKRNPVLGNVADFAVVESGFLPSSVSEHRVRIPCTTRSLTCGELRKLIEGVKVLKENHFPTGRVHALVRLLATGAGEADIRKIFERLSATVATALTGAGFLPGNYKPESEFMKRWPDIREIWDYVF